MKANHMDNRFEITDPDIKNALIGGGGAGIVFILKRFFKNRDSLITRVRHLETQNIKMEMQLSQINNALKYINKDVEEMKAYNEAAHHKTRDLVTKKNIKDDIVDRVYQSLQNIENRLNDEKK